MLSLLMPQRKATAGQDRFFEPFAPRTKAGVNVNEDIAHSLPTVFLCTRILVEPTASHPFRCYERKENGDRTLAKPGAVPSASVLEFPNDEMTGVTFREGRTMHQINYNGGGFAEIVRDKQGNAVELWPIHPSRVSPGKAGSGYAYQVRNDDSTAVGMHADEILHVCGALSEDGIWSKGIIAQARETIGGVLAMDRHAWSYWGSGAQPKGVVIAPGLKSPEDKAAFRRLWKDVHSSPDSCEVVLLPKESDYKPITIPGNDNQFLESRGDGREIICQLYRVPTYMIGARVLGASIEAQAAEFVMNTLYPWIVKWEQQLNLKLLSRAQRQTHFFEMDFTSMLRGNVADRMNGYRVQITTGVRTINECRRLENLPGIGDAGDVHYVPANMFTAEQMVNGNPSAGQGPGSDHTGAPADNPLDHEPEMRRLSRDQRADLEAKLKAMSRELSDRKTDWKEAAKVALLDVFTRMLTKEANAAQPVVKDKGRDLEGWIATFYGKHEELLAEAFKPACAVLRLAGIAEFAEPKNLAAWHKARSVEALRASSRETLANQLPSWSARAERMADEVLRAA